MSTFTRVFLLITALWISVNAFADEAKDELMSLSEQKWQWMADKNVDALAPLFHKESKFVHMSGAWKK